MNDYNIWFQESEILLVIEAENSNEARRIFNKNIKIEKVKK